MNKIFLLILLAISVAIIVMVTTATISGTILALICMLGLILMFVAHYTCALRHGHSGIFFIWEAHKATQMSMNSYEKKTFVLGLVVSVSVIASVFVLVFS